MITPSILQNPSPLSVTTFQPDSSRVGHSYNAQYQNTMQSTVGQQAIILSFDKIFSIKMLMKIFHYFTFDFTSP